MISRLVLFRNKRCRCKLGLNSTSPERSSRSHLDLEATGTSASTSLLELASLGLDLWLLVRVWAKTEVLDSLTGVLWSTEEEGVASGWGAESELIQGEDLTTGSQDAGTGSGGEAERSNAELWNSQETVVVGDGTDDNNGLVVGLLRDVGNDSGERHWWSVDARHKQATEDDLVERGLGAALGAISIALFVMQDIGLYLRAKKR